MSSQEIAVTYRTIAVGKCMRLVHITMATIVVYAYVLRIDAYSEAFGPINCDSIAVGLHNW